jgi:ankyrin repeat protein
VSELFQKGSTPLHVACGKGDLRVVTMLLEAGAEIEAKDSVSAPSLNQSIRESVSEGMGSPRVCL